MEYSLIVKELKEWVNKIPKELDFEQVAWLSYDGQKEPELDISIMFKKKLIK